MGEEIKMITSNPAKEEELIKEIAKAVIDKALAGQEPSITAKEIEATAKRLGLTSEELESFIEYIKSPLGTESFKKTVRLEMWKSGYRPRGWKG